MERRIYHARLEKWDKFCVMHGNASTGMGPPSADCRGTTISSERHNQANCRGCMVDLGGGNRFEVIEDLDEVVDDGFGGVL